MKQILLALLMLLLGIMTAGSLVVTADESSRLCFDDRFLPESDWSSTLEELFAKSPDEEVTLDLPQEYPLEKLENLIYALRRSGSGTGSRHDAGYRHFLFRCKIGDKDFEAPLVISQADPSALSVPAPWLSEVRLMKGETFEIDGKEYLYSDYDAVTERIRELTAENDRHGFLIHPEDGADYLRLCAALFCCKSQGVKRISLWGKNAMLAPVEPDPSLPVLEEAQWPEGWPTPPVYDQPPQLTHRASVRYSDEAIVAGLEGTVHVLVYLDENGKPNESAILKSDAPGLLEEAAQEAAMQCRFSPALKDGQPIKSVLMIPFEFKIRGS